MSQDSKERRADPKGVFVGGVAVDLNKTTGGALLIAAGVLLFLVQQGHIAIRAIWLYWPVALIVVGLMKIVTPRPARDIPSGVFEVVIGFWFQACNLHWFGFTYWQTWPFIFVAIGLSQILKALGRRPLPASEAKGNGHA
jgi:hypothetical protein